MARDSEALAAGESKSSLTSSAGYALFILFLVNVFNQMDRFALAALLEPIKADLLLSDGQLGLLTGFGFALLYAFAGIPIARYADKGVRRNVVAGALAVWSGFTVLGGLAANFWHLLLARIGVGLGESGCQPPSHSLISDLFPVHKRAGALSIHTIGASTGVAIGLGVGGLLGELYGWRTAFIVFGLPGLLLALVVRFTLKEPTRGASDGIAGQLKVSKISDFLTVLRTNVTFRYIIFAGSLGSFLAFGIVQWAPAYFIREFGISVSEAGATFGIVVGISGAIGMLTGGFVADRFIHKDKRWPIWIASIGYGMVLPVYGAVFLAPSKELAFTLVFVATFFSGLGNGPNFAMGQSVVPANMRAMAAATVFFASSLLGVGLGPTFVGVMSDLFAPHVTGPAASLRYGLISALCFAPLCSFLFYRASRTITEDIRKAQEGGPFAANG